MTESSKEKWLGLFKISESRLANILLGEDNLLLGVGQIEENEYDVLNLLRLRTRSGVTNGLKGKHFNFDTEITDAGLGALAEKELEIYSGACLIEVECERDYSIRFSRVNGELNEDKFDETAIAILPADKIRRIVNKNGRVYGREEFHEFLIDEKLE